MQGVEDDLQMGQSGQNRYPEILIKTRYKNFAYMALLIQIIVGQFELVEADGLFHPLRSSGWRILVYVYSAGQMRFRFTSNCPFEIVIFVSGSIRWHYIHH